MSHTLYKKHIEPLHKIIALSSQGSKHTFSKEFTLSRRPKPKRLSTSKGAIKFFWGTNFCSGSARNLQ